MSQTVHMPILLGPIVDSLLEPLRTLPSGDAPGWIVDCTLGGGGHTAGFLEALGQSPELSRHKVLAVDQDPQAIARAEKRFEREIGEGRLELLRAHFGELRPALEGRRVLGLMADLGFSSDQIEDPERGLSFLREGPLDMRMDPDRGQSAYRLLQEIREPELVRILQELGEERFSRRIASAIISRRREGRLPRTTQELTELIVNSVPPPARRGRIHAATRTFQALRIAVNDELGELDSLLRDVILCVETGGRVAILSFHSLEDRKVKLAFRDREGAFESLGRKPIEADEEEVRRNPRSRSAKLRIATRVR